MEDPRSDISMRYSRGGHSMPSSDLGVPICTAGCNYLIMMLLFTLSHQISKTILCSRPTPPWFYVGQARVSLATGLGLMRLREKSASATTWVLGYIK
ncbi:hypothetical protein CDAR_20591 [Caerostris darwini]|uniref:Uncharacterized protein n=1 Tax=Caerostris darwini TaxID=1538125 RepID=A0AAV4QD29_9ARAC|nr:hypothetical protein CDAR_20591 [Caerostris darwini]